MSIIRTKKRENPFAQIDKRILADENLSWKAKGLLAYLIGKPDDWTVRVADIVKRAKDGRDSVYGGLKELESAGYCRRYQGRSEGGKMGQVIYEISESPSDLPLTENPDADGSTAYGKSVSGESVSGKPDSTNIEDSNNEFTNTDRGSRPPIPPAPPKLEEVAVKDLDLELAAIPGFPDLWRDWVKWRRRVRTKAKPSRDLFRRHGSIALRIMQQEGQDVLRQKIERAIDQEWQKFDYPLNGSPGAPIGAKSVTNPDCGIKAKKGTLRRAVKNG